MDPETLLGGPQTPQTAPQAPLTGPQTPLAGPHTPLIGLQTAQARPLQLALRPFVWKADGRMNECTEFLPILQDFVPCRGHCPATLLKLHNIKEAGQGNR